MTWTDITLCRPPDLWDAIDKMPEHIMRRLLRHLAVSNPADIERVLRAWADIDSRP